jgi:hypothetical protein
MLHQDRDFSTLDAGKRHRGTMEAEKNSVIYMGLISGPNTADDTCGKTTETGTMGRGFTVYSNTCILNPDLCWIFWNVNCCIYQGRFVFHHSYILHIVNVALSLLYVFTYSTSGLTEWIYMKFGIKFIVSITSNILQIVWSSLFFFYCNDSAINIVLFKL